MKPKAWDESFDKEFFTEQEIAESDKRAEQITAELKRDKVIKGLEEVIAEAVYPDRPRKFMMSLELAEDALALLKAQELVEPTLDIRHGKSMWRCGSCSTALQPNQIHAKFCFNCGRAVKWDA